MDIYQHFRKDEHEFIDQVMEWKEYVERTYVNKLTDFLDPRQQQIASAIIGSGSDVRVSFFGGGENCERKRALFYPYYHSVSNDEFLIQLFEVEYGKKFVQLDHRQVLGSLMSLGLVRDKFGDILVKDGDVQFFAAKEIADYIRMELTSIGRASVELREISFDQMIAVDESWNESIETVSSLRLDCIVSSVYNISRQKSREYIQRGLVKLNWKVEEDPSVICEPADILSVRKFGRAKLISIDGKTKKDKWKITVGKQN